MTYTSGESSRVGLISVFPERFGDTRWIHWESDGALVCLRELSLNGFVLDSSLCLKTDGRPYCSCSCNNSTFSIRL